MFTLYADDQNLTVTSRDVLPSGSVESVDVKFTFSDDWDGITKLATFKCIDKSGGSTTIYSASLSSGACTIPWEVLVEENEGLDCYAGIYGTSGSTVVMPTVWANLGKVKAGAVIGENSAEPTEDVYEQFVADIAASAAAAEASAEEAAAAAETVEEKLDNFGGTQILRGTGTVTSLSTGTAYWSKGLWRSASGGSGTRTSIEVNDAPNGNITRGWEIVGDGAINDIAQDRVPLVDGATYTLSCYARGTGTLKLQYGVGSYVIRNYSLGGVEAWTKYSFTFTIGESSDGSSNGYVNIYFGNTSTGTLEICGTKLETGNVATDWSPAPEDIESAHEELQHKSLIGYYPCYGDNIAPKEITDSWETILENINNGVGYKYHIGDWKTLSLNKVLAEDGETIVAYAQTLHMQVMGNDTHYKNGYSTNVNGHHIDFISSATLTNPSTNPFVYNSTATNNGTADESSPWLASDLYARLNDETYGIIAGIPDVSSYITEKKANIEIRYSSAGTLEYSTGRKWANIGKLWLLSEIEVFGTAHCSDSFGNSEINISLNRGGGVNTQYPYFVGRQYLPHDSWLLNTVRGSSAAFCTYNASQGGSSYATATATYLGVPLCFRLGGTEYSS